jgi:hypothetical protein
MDWVRKNSFFNVKTIFTSPVYGNKMLGLLKPTWNRRASKVKLASDLSLYNVWSYFNRNLISASVSTPFSVSFCSFFSETFLTEQLRSLIFLISKRHLPYVLTKYFYTLHLTILCYKYEVRWHFNSSTWQMMSEVTGSPETSIHIH